MLGLHCESVFSCFVNVYCQIFILVNMMETFELFCVQMNRVWQIVLKYYLTFDWLTGIWP